MKHDHEGKIIILIGDGMADYPVDELDGRTPLEAAITPNMDFLAENGAFGLVKTIPDGMEPGSDVANLSIFGYDPERHFTGRAPLEALGMNIDLGPNDAAFRCNIVDIRNGIMHDNTAGHIDSAFSDIIIKEIGREFGSDKVEFFPGVSYRNLMVIRDYEHKDMPFTVPPHDIHGKEADKFLPEGQGSELLKRIMKASVKIINDSSAIKKGKSEYKGSPVSVWLWGGGRRPAIETLGKKYGLRGNTISAVDLIHGIGIAAGLKPLKVEGATGYLDTNYAGKVSALLNALEESSYVFLHVEAPDESGHEGNLVHKIRAIEDFDKKIVGEIYKEIINLPDYTLLVMPDHATPLSLRTHSPEPVPFCILSKSGISGFSASSSLTGFNEKSALSTGNYIDKAHTLIEIMLNGERI